MIGTRWLLFTTLTGQAPRTFPLLTISPPLYTPGITHPIDLPQDVATSQRKLQGRTPPFFSRSSFNRPALCQLDLLGSTGLW